MGLLDGILGGLGWIWDNTVGAAANALWDQIVGGLVDWVRTTALAHGNVPDGTPEGVSLQALTLASSGPRPKYFLPVNAWYTMRMQSNPYLKWAAP